MISAIGGLVLVRSACQSVSSWACRRVALGQHLPAASSGRAGTRRRRCPRHWRRRRCRTAPSATTGCPGGRRSPAAVRRSMPRPGPGSAAGPRSLPPTESASCLDGCDDRARAIGGLSILAPGSRRVRPGTCASGYSAFMRLISGSFAAAALCSCLGPLQEVLQRLDCRPCAVKYCIETRCLTSAVLGLPQHPAAIFVGAVDKRRDKRLRAWK